MAAGAPNRAAWPSNDDYTLLSLAVVVFGSIALGVLAWWNYHAIIAGGVAALARAEIWLVHRFTPALDPLGEAIRISDPHALTVCDLFGALNDIGRYLRIPAIALILVLAALCFTRDAPSRFTRALDLDGLIREHALSFRSLAAFVTRNLRLVPLDSDRLRPSDPALHAREWVARFATLPDGSLDESRMRRGLALQLGPLWSGIERAPTHFHFFYVVFALHLEQKRNQAVELLSALAEALPGGTGKETAGPDRPYAIPDALIARADTILRSGALKGRAEQITGRHAYTVPALMSLLVEARRRSGVLVPAQFAFLKLVDRNFWYALHSLGFEGDGPGQNTHPNPRVEAAGARDHWAAERLAMRPLMMRSVERAADAVRAALVQHDAVTAPREMS